jgi:hypothetical protein
MIFFFSQAETFIVPENMKDQTMENVHEVPVYQLSRSAFVLRMATGVLLVNLLVFALSFLSLRQSRFNYVQRAAVTTNNLSLMLEQNIDGSIDKIDVVLEAAVEEFGHRFARGGINRNEMKSFLAGLAVRLPEVNCISAADAQGKHRAETGNISGNARRPGGQGEG